MNQHMRRYPGTTAPYRARAAGVVIGLALSGVPALASAACVAPSAGLLWSYPGNGSLDVPTDADLFFTGEVGGVPTLNGTPLSRLSLLTFDLGELEPQTTYEVRWETASITFTTGDRSRHSPPEPTDELELTREAPDARLQCPLVEPQGCFDTGAPTVVVLEDHLPKLATVVDVLSCDGSVRSLVWPAECGPPMIASDDPIVCVSSRTTLGAGLSEATGYVCSVPAGDLAKIPRSSGCVGAWPPADVPTIQAAGTGTSADDARPTDEESSGCTLRGASPRPDGWLALLAALALAMPLGRRARS